MKDPKFLQELNKLKIKSLISRVFYQLILFVFHVHKIKMKLQKILKWHAYLISLAQLFLEILSLKEISLEYFKNF